MSQCILFFSFFFFKHKTAYEMRISDWSSDVCSSDLEEHRTRTFRPGYQAHGGLGDDAELAFGAADEAEQVVARRIEVLAAQFDDGPVDEDQDRQRVV